MAQATLSPMLDSGPLIIASPLATDEACFSVPAVRALHFAQPDRPLTILCPEEQAEIWKTVTGITEVIPHSASASARKIAKLIGNFSQSLAWEDSAAAAAFTRKGITKRIGPSLDKLQKQLSNPVEIHQRSGPVEHRVKDYLMLAEKLGTQPYDAINFQPAPRPALLTQLRIGVVPGSDYGPSAEWPLERFRELINYRAAEYLIFDAPGRPTAAKKLSDLGQVVRNEDALRELVSCHLVIASDGSIPHLAAHLGTPCVIIFGPNEPAWKRPLGTIHRVVHERVACSSCFLDKCPLDHRCLNEISVGQVNAELEALLSGS